MSKYLISWLTRIVLIQNSWFVNLWCEITGYGFIEPYFFERMKTIKFDFNEGGGERLHYLRGRDGGGGQIVY